jgi:hypothetical protein
MILNLSGFWGIPQKRTIVTLPSPAVAILPASTAILPPHTTLINFLITTSSSSPFHMADCCVQQMGWNVVNVVIASWIIVVSIAIIIPSPTSLLE